MTVTTPTFDERRAPGTASGFLGGLIARFERARARSRRYHRVFAELESYRDRELADLGLARADIPHIAERAAVDV